MKIIFSPLVKFIKRIKKNISGKDAFIKPVKVISSGILERNTISKNKFIFIMS
jgi:hypothetical protein